MNKMNQVKMPDGQHGRRKLRNDLVFIVSLLLAVTLLCACLLLFRGDGDCVKVMVDGKLYGTYPLGTDTRVEILTDDDNEQCNVLVIREGRAFVESATCPDGICSDHRPIFRDGESIVCLPHKVVIIAYATKKDPDAPDITATLAPWMSFTHSADSAPLSP